MYVRVNSKGKNYKIDVKSIYLYICSDLRSFYVLSTMHE